LSSGIVNPSQNFLAAARFIERTIRRRFPSTARREVQMDDDPGSRALAYGPRVADDVAGRVTRDRVTRDGALAFTRDDEAPDDQIPGGGSGGGGGAPAPATPVKLPSPFPPKLDAKLQEVTAPHPLRAAVDGVAGKPRQKKMALALCDLTTSGQRLYAGVRDGEQRFIASTAKLAVLFASFQLRKALREAGNLVTDKKITKDTQFFDAVMRQWRPLIRRHFHKPQGSNDSLPSLAQIFEATPRASGGWDVDFATTARGNTGAPYNGRLLNTMRHSDDAAAGRCITDLGFPYLNGCLAEAGFYKRPRGLWVSLNYAGQLWWPETVKDRGTTQAGTARSLVELMTLLELDELVPGTRKEMFDLMAGMDPGLAKYGGSFAREGVLIAVPDANDQRSIEIRGKFGFTYDPGTNCDAALVKHAASPDPVRYTAAYLNGELAGDAREAARALDVALVASRKPPP
jgi:hypothetical protein